MILAGEFPSLCKSKRVELWIWIRSFSCSFANEKFKLKIAKPFVYFFQNINIIFMNMYTNTIRRSSGLILLTDLFVFTQLRLSMHQYRSHPCVPLSKYNYPDLSSRQSFERKFGAHKIKHACR